MMNVTSFLLFSSLEWFALIIFALVMYRFEVRDHIGQIIFSSFLLSLVSYMLFNVLDLAALATIVQLVFVFLFFWLLFKIPVFFAGPIVINGYLAAGVVQSSFYYFIQQFGVAVIQPATAPAFIMQTASSLILLLIARLAVKFRLGFSFVQQTEGKTKLSGTNLKLMLLTLLGYIVLAGMNFFATDHMLIIIMAVTAAFISMQYWALKKEYEAAFWHRNKESF